MKRLITIILIIIAVAAVFLGISWLLSRRTAEKSGTTPQSFREFVTGDTGEGTTPSTPPGTISSDFGTENPDTPGATTGQPGGIAGTLTPTTRTSVFTNTNLSPTTSNSPRDTGTSVGSGIGANGSTPTNGGVLPTGSAGPTVPILTNTAPECTDSDLNITFTADELKRLQALQDRFYEIAQTLHNDGDVQAQMANYTAFKLKQANYNELLTYCTDTLARNIPSTPALKNKVPTPFWYELGDIRYNPTIRFEGFNVVRGNGEGDTPLGYIMGPGQIGGEVDSYRGNPDVFKRSMERLLRLNLW